MPMRYEAALIDAGLRGLKSVFEDYRSNLSKH